MSPTRKVWDFGRPSATPLNTLSIFAVALILTPGTLRADVLGWHTLPNSPSAARHDDVQFLDLDLGWVVNSNGQVWQTTDGGGSWELQLQVSSWLRSVHFLDPSLGFVGTISAPPESLLYRTTNGGASWTNVVLPPPVPPGICGLMGVGDHVFASGAYFETTIPRFLHSTDRGATWTNIDLSPYAMNAIDCYFVSPDSGFVVGSRREQTNYYPLILFTADAGQTWVTRYWSNAFDRDDYCWKIFFVNRLVGYVSIQGRAILKTTDGGVTWVRKPVGHRFIQGVGFATETLGWVDGADPPMVTTNGGDTWAPTYLTGDPGFPWSDGNRFQMMNESLGYCAGRRIYKYEPETTGLPVALAPPAISLELASYPNPASRAVTITYVLAEGGPVQVRIYTVLGRYIRTLHEGWQAAGTNAVLWHGQDDFGRRVGRGTYIYRVDAAGSAESERLVLLE